MSSLSVEIEDEVAILTLNRPKANAFDAGLMAELSAAFSAQGKARAVVLTSALPGLFSAGWDLPQLVDRDRAGMEEFVSTYCDLVRQIFVFGAPVVAATTTMRLPGPLFSARLSTWSAHPVLSKPLMLRGVIPTDGSPGRNDLSWKAKRANNTEPLRSTPTHTRLAV